MVSEQVRAQLLTEFSGRDHPYPADRSILQLFEEWAWRAPTSPAVTFGETTLSYRALDQRANALAATLRTRGVGKGDFVPLAVRNGLDLPVSVLALMKLGAPFVPLDDLWPANRFADVIETMRPKVVLHGVDVHTETLPEDLRLAVRTEDLPERQQGDFGEPAGMHDLIYGFYTSGSTGAPKCALNAHQGLLNRFLYMTRQFGAATDEVVLQNSRQVFDSSIWQLLWPLTNGARVVIPQRDGVLDLSTTIDTIHQHGITMLDFVPSIFNTLVELIAAEPDLVRRIISLRTVLIGGEEINTRAVRCFREMLPDVRIVNTYGPTECSIGSVFHTVTDADHDSIPVGRPIDNTYVVILDQHLDLVAPGTVGEIYIGGDCLGLGYLNDPERTAEVFIPNPFAEVPGEQLYRTGDHGQWREDGMLVFEGRSDQQIKIGGVRVELSEIELALQTHPDVREAKVVAHGELDSRILVAFVACSNELTEDVLREHARNTLPPYLLPQRFRILDRMPLTPNGKTDRKALAALTEPSRTVGVPLQGVAREIHQIWQELVPGGQIGTQDSFFDVGGNSLLAQRLALALNARFGTKLSVREVVRHQSIDGQAALLRGDHDTRSAFEEMTRDAVLPSDLTVSTPASGKLDHILLTGATGFVGGQLLRDLLHNTDAVVYCLVRANDPAAARERIVANLSQYRLWDPQFAHRMVAVPGDLGAVDLGLTRERYQHLAKMVEIVLHNGAMVNLVREYATHRAVNVHGTTEILRLACTATTKPVHFISTLSALPDGGPEASAPSCSHPPDGYSQSKLVGEWLVDAAADRGLPIAVHRLGEVMPHTQHGLPSNDGLVDLLMHACIRLGVTFRSGVKMDYLPVDRACAVVVAAMRHGETGYFHLRHPHNIRLDDVLDAFRKAFELADVSYADFLDRLRVTSDTDRDLARVLALLPATETELPALFSELDCRYQSDRVDRLVQGAGLTWPPLDSEVFDTYARGVGAVTP